MTIRELLAELEAADIRLHLDGDDLLAAIGLEASLDPYRERIAVNKPALLTELRLRRAIIAAATAQPDAFDRPAYDALWARWTAADSPAVVPDDRSASTSRAS